MKSLVSSRFIRVVAAEVIEENGLGHTEGMLFLNGERFLSSGTFPQHVVMHTFGIKGCKATREKSVMLLIQCAACGLSRGKAGVWKAGKWSFFSFFCFCFPNSISPSYVHVPHSYTVDEVSVVPFLGSVHGFWQCCVCLFQLLSAQIILLSLCCRGLVLVPWDKPVTHERCAVYFS